MSTLFRFVAERPVQRTAAPTLRYRLIQAYGAGADETALHGDLGTAKQNADRQAMLTRAQQFIASDDFTGDVAALPFGLQPIDAWLLAREDMPEPAQLIEEIRRLATKRPKEIVATEQFKTTRRRVADSLLALTVTGEREALRAQLLRTSSR